MQIAVAAFNGFKRSGEKKPAAIEPANSKSKTTIAEIANGLLSKTFIFFQSTLITEGTSEAYFKQMLLAFFIFIFISI